MKPTTRRLLLPGTLLLFAACGTVKETGRSQFTAFSDEQMSQLGVQAYQEAIAGYEEIKTGPQAEMVRRVGTRIAQASGRNYQWEFKLLNAPKVVNAFCLPGGKIAVFTGILPITANEDGLAIVMGHEVAHATSGHGNERMSQGSLAEMVLGVGDAVLGYTKLSPTAKEGVLTAYYGNPRQVFVSVGLNF
jgi:predicted Zn-dependent protease